jgi:dUTP pyrophosphatase
MELLYTGTAPTRAYADDAGLDLYVHGDYTIDPGEYLDIDLNVRIKTPPGYWVLLTGRSSSMRNRRLLVAQGVIDPGYIGPLYAGVTNMGDEFIHIKHGERIAQLIAFRNETENLRLVHVDTLPPTERGDRGFGSSGR